MKCCGVIEVGLRSVGEFNWSITVSPFLTNRYRTVSYGKWRRGERRGGREHALAHTWSWGSSVTLQQLNSDTLWLCLQLLRHFIPLLRLADPSGAFIKQRIHLAPSPALRHTPSSLLIFLSLSPLQHVSIISLTTLQKKKTFLCASLPRPRSLEFFFFKQGPLCFITGQRGSSSTLHYPLISSLQSPNTHFLLHCYREKHGREWGRGD